MSKKKSAYDKGFNDGWNKCANLFIFINMVLAFIVFLFGVIKYVMS